MMDELMLTFYGDDFTGSTDVLESLSRNGVSTVLFLEPPSLDDIARFEDVRAIGIAGTSRSMMPAEMDEELPTAFETLGELDTPLVHYKVCSTFDSAPDVGSIGHAIDLGQSQFDSPFVPVVVAVPSLEPRGRYVLFGNLFATVDDETYRIDRHPTMSTHPVTPMTEGDLRVHLSEQTDREIGLLDVRLIDNLGGTDLDGELGKIVTDNEIVVFDGLNDEHQEKIGRLIWQRCLSRDTNDPLFSASSSGLEYALVNHWRTTGVIEEPTRSVSAGSVDQILVMSGSASPVNEDQISWALNYGFEGIRLNAERLIDSETVEDAAKEAIDRAVATLSNGQSPLLYTARGPSDPAIDRTNKRIEELEIDPTQVGELLGHAQGRITRTILEETDVDRVCVAGGDTSGHIAPHLDIFALEFIVPVGPGSPLCRAASHDPYFDGVEIALKGGQVQTTHNEADYFGMVREGGIST